MPRKSKAIFVPSRPGKKDMKPDKTTPMMAQYMEIKEKYSDYLLMYRLGDFYELFFDDAAAASGALGLAKTTHHTTYMGREVPMCGIPHHAFDAYIPRLIRRGFKVAVCDQLETPEDAKRRDGSKAVIRREVTRIITAGTLTEDSLLPGSLNNYLAALCFSGGIEPKAALAMADISTGEFRLASWSADAVHELRSFVARSAPSEIIVPGSMLEDKKFNPFVAEFKDKIVARPEAFFDPIGAGKSLCALFGLASADSLGSFSELEFGAIGALLGYIKLTQIGALPKLARPRREDGGDFMHIDSFSIRNLEVFEGSGGGDAPSLFSTMDRTKTPMGRRLLKGWLAAPLTDSAKINERLSRVEFFRSDMRLCDGLRGILSRAHDVDRIMGRLGLNRSGPRDLKNISETLAIAPEIRILLADAARGALDSPLSAMMESIAPMDDLAHELEGALVDEPPLLVSAGAFIRPGFDPTLDGYRRLNEDSRGVIAELQARYSLDASIASLRIKYNTLSGYFIEVPSAKATPLMDPKSGFRHRQTLVGSVRFTTPELEEMEHKILAANEKYQALELELFRGLCADVMARAADIAALSATLAELDALSSLASLADENDYCRPAIDDSLAFEIRAGRHPLVERALRRTGGAFIPNDSRFEEAADDGGATGAPEKTDSRLWLLTGPNMAGKSTFLRQNALIVIMAQMGSFVPAASAHIGVVDKLFSRVGASDNLAQGLSTFMVEMSETAAILNMADERSFVILDEIGRGTATFDGLSIAWAVLEYLSKINRCRGLFATHYHELGAITGKLGNVTAHAMETKEYEGDIIFMHKVRPGAAESSYGIHVARLAGIPRAVTERAGQILETLERDGAKGHAGRLAEIDLFNYSAQPVPSKADEDRKTERLAARLREIEPDSLSPKSALEILYEIKNLLDNT